MIDQSLGDLERDAVAELINIAIGRAAAALSQLIGDEVTLSVPFVEFSDTPQVAKRLALEMQGIDTVAVRQHFKGRMDGDILLIFPERHSFDLVRSMLGDQVPLAQLTDLEQEALLEIGNIVLNTCLGSLANQLGLTLESSLPSYVRGSPTRVLTSGRIKGDPELVLFLHVDFALLNRDIGGYVAFIMDIASAQTFIDAVRTAFRAALGG